MLLISRKFYLRHLLVLIYLLALGLVLSLVVYEESLDRESFILSDSTVVANPKPSTLSIPGENFSVGLKGVTAQTLVNERALLWRQFAGVPVREIDVKGDLLLATSHGKGRLVSLKLNDGKTPKLLDSIQLPETIKQIKIFKDKALVGMHGYGGYALIDLQDPGDLTLVSHTPFTGLISSMVVVGEFIYFTDIYEGIGRINMADDRHALENLVSLDSSWRLARRGNLMVAGTLKGKVHLYDISRDGQLHEVGKLSYSTNVRGVALTKGALVVALADNSLRVFNLESWPELQESAQLKLSGSALRLKNVPGKEGVSANLVAGGLVLVDVSRPEAPVISGRHRVAKTYRGMKLESGKVFGASSKGLEAFSVDEVERGRYAEAAENAMINQEHFNLKGWNGRVVGFNDSSVENLGVTGSLSTAQGRYQAMAGNDSIRFFEEYSQGDFRRLEYLITVKGAKSAEIRGGYMYVAHRNGLKVFKGTRPDEMVAISELKLPGLPRSFVYSDSALLLVATRDAGVLIVDVSNPERPELMATIAPAQHLQAVKVVYDIFVDGQTAYVSYGNGGIHVVDVSVPSQPRLLQIVDTPGYAKKMVVHDGLLLVADGTDGLYMIDIDPTGDALPIGSLETPLRVDEIAVASDGLIISSHPGGTMKIPLPRRLQDVRVVNPQEVRVGLDKNEPGQYVYLYDEYAAGKVKVVGQ
jgi:hypothetical protein